MAPPWLIAVSTSQTQVILLPQPQVPGTTGMHYHAWLIFKICFVEADSHYTTQTGLEVLALSDLPALVSQNAGIIGADHHTQLISSVFMIVVLLPSVR